MTSEASLSKALEVPSLSSGRFSSSPKIWGKNLEKKVGNYMHCFVLNPFTTNILHYVTILIYATTGSISFHNQDSSSFSGNF